MGNGHPFHHHQYQQYGLQSVSISTASSMDVQGVFLSTASSTDVQSVSISTTSRMDVLGVSLSTANRMDVQGVTISTASSMDVQCAGCMTFHRRQCRRAVRIPSTASSMDVQGVPFFLNAGMSDCPASGQSGTGMNKMPMLEPVRGTGIRVPSPVLRYRTEIQDAGMPMPEGASTSMPMHSYGTYTVQYEINL
jgi:hypothetical protein